MPTTVIRHAAVLVTMDKDRREIHDGGMVIRDGVIEARITFETAIGRCGAAWSARGLVGVQLPEARERDTRTALACDADGKLVDGIRDSPVRVDPEIVVATTDRRQSAADNPAPTLHRRRACGPTCQVHRQGDPRCRRPFPA